jgi:hypothetical protein
MKLEARLRRALEDQAERVEVGQRLVVSELRSPSGGWRGGRKGALVAAAALLVVVTVAAVAAILAVTDRAGAPFIETPPGTQEQPPVDERTVYDYPAPDSVEAQLLAMRARSVAVVDLEAGRTTVYPLRPYGLDLDYLDSATMTGDGHIVVWGESGTVGVFHPDTAEPVLVHQPGELIHRPEVAASVSVAVTLDGGKLWVVQQGTDHGEVELAGRAELVDITSGTVELVAQLPPNSVWAAVTPRGLVLNTHRFADTGPSEEGSHEVYELTLDGQINVLGPGEALAASGTWVAVRVCERHEPPRNCEVELVDTDTGERQAVARPVDGEWTRVAQPQIPTNTPRWNATSPDGRILLGIVTPTDRAEHQAETHLVAVHPNRPDAPEALHLIEGKTSAGWDPTGDKLILIHAENPRNLTILNLRDRSTLTVADAVPAGHHVVTIR